MAPNRKQLNLLSLADLDIPVQAKFLPLTHPLEQAQQTIKEPVRTAAKPIVTECASYWDWTADVPEEPKDLFSASSLESNLIKDSQLELSSDIIYATDIAENDDYWNESVEEPESATKPQHDTYWSWPADPKDARIAAILKDEAARQQFLADKIVEDLVNTRPTDTPSQQKQESDSYWSWESSSALIVSESLDEVYSQSYWEWKSDDRSKAQVNKAEIIRSILESEACRQVVSLAKIEESLQEATLPETCATQASSDEYWSWPVAEDNYWSWSAKPVAATQGYWEW
jgi:hypothetical protein